MHSTARSTIPTVSEGGFSSTFGEPVARQRAQEQRVRRPMPSSHRSSVDRQGEEGPGLDTARVRRRNLTGAGREDNRSRASAPGALRYSVWRKATRSAFSSSVSPMLNRAS